MFAKISPRHSAENRLKPAMPSLKNKPSLYSFHENPQILSQFTQSFPKNSPSDILTFAGTLV